MPYSSDLGLFARSISGLRQFDTGLSLVAFLRSWHPSRQGQNAQGKYKLFNLIVGAFNTALRFQVSPPCGTAQLNRCTLNQ